MENSATAMDTASAAATTIPASGIRTEEGIAATMAATISPASARVVDPTCAETEPQEKRMNLSEYLWK